MLAPTQHHERRNGGKYQRCCQPYYTKNRFRRDVNHGNAEKCRETTDDAHDTQKESRAHMVSQFSLWHRPRQHACHLTVELSGAHADV
jgi:hypothetical protein